MKNNIQSNKAGFSLVELMVVVAIIGILASIAVPNFLKFQAKAKQSDAKVQLSGLHGAQKTFFAEYSSYHADLVYVGFIPDGIPLAAGCPSSVPTATRKYTVGFVNFAPNAFIPGIAPAAGSCATAITAATDGRSFYSGGGLAAVPTAVVAGSGVVATNVFSALAEGPLGGAATDVWQINQDKVLTNDRSGI
jgi:type IV pilus assembly protein PilA